jgi:hypothetical protein
MVLDVLGDDVDGLALVLSRPARGAPRAKVRGEGRDGLADVTQSRLGLLGRDRLGRRGLAGCDLWSREPGRVRRVARRTGWPANAGCAPPPRTGLRRRSGRGGRAYAAARGEHAGPRAADAETGQGVPRGSAQAGDCAPVPRAGVRAPRAYGRRAPVPPARRSSPRACRFGAGNCSSPVSNGVSCPCSPAVSWSESGHAHERAGNGAPPPGVPPDEAARRRYLGQYAGWMFYPYPSHGWIFSPFFLCFVIRVVRFRFTSLRDRRRAERRPGRLP